jgi:hypothetical protein
VYLYGPLLLVFALLALAGWWTGRRAPGYGRQAAFLAALGIGLMLFPFFTINFDYRFMTPAVPLLPAGAALGQATLRHARRRSSVEGDALRQGDEDGGL